MRFILIFLIVFFSLWLEGCGAIYKYERLDNNCSLTIVSAREVNAGQISLDKNCAIKGGAESLTNNEKAFEAINSLVNKIP